MKKTTAIIMAKTTYRLTSIPSRTSATTSPPHTQKDDGEDFATDEQGHDHRRRTGGGDARLGNDLPIT
jgi:hypothetical protein